MGLEKRDRIVFVAFYDRKPWDVITAKIVLGKGDLERVLHVHHDWYWCNRDHTLYWQENDGGPVSPIRLSPWADGKPVEYWAADGTEVIECSNCVRLDQFPEGFNPETLFDDYREIKTEYCAVCNDHLPVEDYARTACHHVHWSNDVGSWVGCGASDADSEDHKESFITLLRKTRLAKVILVALEKQQYEMYCPDGEINRCLLRFGTRNYREHLLSKRDEEIVDGIEIGALWLLSLEAGVTSEAEETTKGWIKEYLTTYGR